MFAAFAATAMLLLSGSAASAAVFFPQAKILSVRDEIIRTATAPARSNYLTASGAVSAVWANSGEDKVTQDELRAKVGKPGVLNKVWDGSRVAVSGARNEVTAFNLVLEAGTSVAAQQVSVQFSRLVGPNGFVISSTPATNKAGIFNWTQRDIELFQVRYLTIRGLSVLSYGTYDERHVPARMRLPASADGAYSGGWNDRPDHDKNYPDIGVPLELVPSFSIAAGQNQSIWADVYIPADAPPGLFTGEVTISLSGAVQYRVPVELTVHNFALPDEPTSKTMVATSYHDVAKRYTGVEYPEPASTQDKLAKVVMDRQMMLAHRHKISLIDDNSGATAWTQDRPRPEWERRLSGALFTATYGYRGPGTGTGNNVFSIGTYGLWRDWWGTPNRNTMWTRTNGWESWFATKYPDTERFLYLIDESEDYAQTELWAGWMKNNPGVGANLKSFATADLLKVRQFVPSLGVSASWLAVGDKTLWQKAVNAAKSQNKGVYLYNGQRPASGSFAIEDDGIALRELAWGQYKKKIDRWFFWSATYYDDYQGERGPTNVFKTAQTFGGAPSFDSLLGMTGWNASNGDGVLFYPGIDAIFPKESLALPGPIASLRLKHWRRGIQDVDYLALAAKKNPTAVTALINKMVPKVLWENGVDDPADPTWVMAPVSWSTDPDVWEAARAQLVAIIEAP